MILARNRYLISATEQPRVRRAADASGLAFAVLLFLWSFWVYQHVEDVDVAVADIVAWVPDWLRGTASVTYILVLGYMVILFLAVLTQWRTRLDAVRDMILAVLATGLLGMTLVRLVSGTWPRLLPEWGSSGDISQYPILGVAIVTSALLVVAPHLTRPLRRVGWGNDPGGGCCRRCFGDRPPQQCRRSFRSGGGGIWAGSLDLWIAPRLS